MPGPSSLIFSVDAETDGLYGPVWAIGAVVLEGEDVTAEFVGQIDPTTVTDQWVRDNIVPHLDLPRYDSREALLGAFWAFWMEHKGDAICVADFGAPVEAGLFRACVEMAPSERMWDGPYPMHELGTALLLAGLDPDLDRFEMAGIDGLTKHNPRDDALTAGICWRRATPRK